MDIGDEYVVGDDIDVYVSAKNPKKYVVDTEGYLENRAAQLADTPQEQAN